MGVDLVSRRCERGLLKQSERNIRRLLCLKDSEESVERLRASLPTLAPEEAIVLLHCYALAGWARLIDVLLFSGACHVDARRAKDGCTALHIAEYKGHTEVSRVLQ